RLPKSHEPSDETVVAHCVPPRLLPSDFERAPAVEIRDWKGKEALHQIRVKHRGECRRKKIPAQDVMRFVFEFERTWVGLGEECIEDGRAETSTGNSADGEKMRRKIRIRILNAAKNGGSPVSRPNSTPLGRDDKEWMQRPSPVVFFCQTIPR